MARAWRATVLCSDLTSPSQDTVSKLLTVGNIHQSGKRPRLGLPVENLPPLESLLSCTPVSHGPRPCFWPVGAGPHLASL